MKVLVLGATGRTGRLIAQRLIDRGHDVTAIGRRDPGITGVVFRGVTLTDADAVRAAASGMDAVLSGLAVSKGNPICSAVAGALSGLDGLRYVTIAGAGVDAPGDAKGAMDRFASLMMRTFVPHILIDRQAELRILQQSRLRWTMMRPPVLNNKPATGRVQISFDRPSSSAISRADLAQAVVDALGNGALIGRAPFVAG